ncbi:MULTISPECIES: type II toxin-antitoxin system death-on-curing family toxin [Curtobacterium]|uniref:Type II toxin-antitoxin system death-on-curing family toxin n=1 Tax=Curtobacterium flaccumfaciens pv. flaccumfaciens TaxID=138532 RepID=A0A9Q2W807_9MICO|nr:type II toxin-antitoxin system death-on-curing family toxin [Curtobacterium flaccumfaciens]MBT1543226.1 type II toxin-antitoxin system death-on-curing family toxin [Curtobacterium flaccumfaciens pv. flaccumfaciens]MCS6578000.1 type II toxin-antitoxin system death-on-curing family toxin [Curtobacterium flaccumfaciens]
MIHLTTDEALHIARRTLGADSVIRDVGLLEAAVARPAASVGGNDAYPTLVEKAAALVHSALRNHALVDGNKRLGLMLLVVFLGVNGVRLHASNDQAYDFIVAIAEGELDAVTEIAAALSAMVSDA